MASSSSYWHFSEAVKEELDRISGLAIDVHCNLESSDDPGALAVELAEIKKRLDATSEQIGAAVPVLKKAEAALALVPEFKQGK